MKRTIRFEAGCRNTEISVLLKVTTEGLTLYESEEVVDEQIDNIFKALQQTCSVSKIKIKQ